MKRIVSAIIITAMAFAAVGCSGSNASKQEETSTRDNVGSGNNSGESNVSNAVSNENSDSGDMIILASEMRKLENGLSAVKYSGDCGFDEFLSLGGASSDAEVVAFLSKKVLSSEGLSFGESPFGCSTISTIDSEGNYLFGRNFD